jgi:N-acetylglucosamine kinase-like BadF-type ATPase
MDAVAGLQDPENRDQLILGIDGGGTKTLAWLAEAGFPERTLGTGVAGPSNQRAVGPIVAMSNLEQAVDKAFESAGIGRQTVQSACLGLAGADRSSDRSVVERWANETRLATRLIVVNDALPLLYVNPLSGQGVALICGTGSLAYGRHASGRTARAGGWGYLLGDEGSAYAIGRSVLTAVLRSFDGSEQPTQLKEEVLKSLGISTVPDIVPEVYGAEVPRAVIAELAPLAFSACAAGDPVAAEILNEASRQLASMVNAVCRRLELTDSPLVLSGSVLLHQQTFRSSILAELADNRFSHVVVAADPVQGSVRLAAEQLNTSWVN